MTTDTVPLPTIDADALAPLARRSLLLTQEWETKELAALLDVARSFEALDRARRSMRLLQGELAYALFFDQSTRTKSAWAGASARLGMHPVIVDGSSTQISHGETAAETGTMLGMNAHAMGVRHDIILGEGNSLMVEMKKGIDEYLSVTDDSRAVPIVNLQCDIDHPTQTMADLMWLQERFPDGLAGKKIAVSWAYSPSYAKPLSVPQGLIMLLTRFGAKVQLAHPEGYRLMDDCLNHAKSNAQVSGGSFEVVGAMDDAFADADIVYPKSWGPYDLMLERVEASKAKDDARMGEIEKAALTRNAQFTDWICDERRIDLTTDKNALYMHCLPADIGAEVSPGIMAKHRIDVAKEANKKVYIVMAALAAAKVPNLADRLAELAK